MVQVLPRDARHRRRQLLHPGATLDAFEIRDGYRYQALTTNTPRGQLAFLEARDGRAHARVEDRIRTGKDTGIGVSGHEVRGGPFVVRLVLPVCG